MCAIDLDISGAQAFIKLCPPTSPQKKRGENMECNAERSAPHTYNRLYNSLCCIEMHYHDKI